MPSFRHTAPILWVVLKVLDVGMITSSDKGNEMDVSSLQIQRESLSFKETQKKKTGKRERETPIMAKGLKGFWKIVGFCL